MLCYAVPSSLITIARIFMSLPLGNDNLSLLATSDRVWVNHVLGSRTSKTPWEGVAGLVLGSRRAGVQTLNSERSTSNVMYIVEASGFETVLMWYAQIDERRGPRLSGLQSNPSCTCLETFIGTEDKYIQLGKPNVGVEGRRPGAAGRVPEMIPSKEGKAIIVADSRPVDLLAPSRPPAATTLSTPVSLRGHLLCTGYGWCMALAIARAALVLMLIHGHAHHAASLIRDRLINGDMHPNAMPPQGLGYLDGEGRGSSILNRQLQTGELTAVAPTGDDT
ncbi:hypothetical protein LX32DRAFT_684876 [Colletotrichum zoysiae]|uniref:Uncharacterized protein n=1 Tax=Colletotrichum zoysiae TaxID=1216348 RepID=A0AAD9M208_9PEZI|nr:hypothetical protein LX32DRAFT_684876 [Colletotrichum zoysiae]